MLASALEEELPTFDARQPSPETKRFIVIKSVDQILDDFCDAQLDSDDDFPCHFSS